MFKIQRYFINIILSQTLNLFYSVCACWLNLSHMHVDWTSATCMWIEPQPHACGLNLSHMHVDWTSATCMWIEPQPHACGLNLSHMHVDWTSATRIFSWHANNYTTDVAEEKWFQFLTGTLSSRSVNCKQIMIQISFAVAVKCENRVQTVCF